VAQSVLEEGVDVVVATPGRLLEHLRAHNLDLAKCQAVVLDEVDVLLGRWPRFLACVL
jgi:superfamily II DNA/RNA helicase